MFWDLISNALYSSMLNFNFQTKYTMKHILIECTDRAHIRKTFYSANNIKELFQNTQIDNVI